GRSLAGDRPLPGVVAPMRRPLLAVVFATACHGRPAAPAAGARRAKAPLLLADFAPRSMLHVPAHAVPRARFAAIDFHQHVDDHLDQGRGVLDFEPAKLVALMDAANVRTLVILTGPRGPDLSRLVAALVRPYPDRFVVFTQVDWA